MRGALEFWRWLIGGTLIVGILLCGPGALAWWLTGENWTFPAFVGVELVVMVTIAEWE